MGDFYNVLIGAGILAFQYFLSKRNSVYWGAILPVSYIIFLIVLYVKGIQGGIGTLVLPAILGLSILCLEWGTARDDLKKKRQKELEKMQAQDL